MSGFDIDFKFLPPKLQAQLWVLALDANTSKLNLAYNPGSFSTSLAYNYGGKLEASVGVRRFKTKLKVHPSTGDLDLGLVFRGFRFGVSQSFQRRSTGLTLGYGAKLLPFPHELSDVFNSAAYGFQSVARDIRSAPDNPLKWYRLHSDDVGTISKAVSVGQQIEKLRRDSQRFGAGLRLNFSSETGLVIYGGALLRF